jgi:inner membrane transporter RhtA
VLDPVRRRTRPGAAVPAPVLVLASIVSVQVGGAMAKGLFAQVGPAGAVLLRLVFGALILVALVRPRVADLDRAALATTLGFGLVLALMNFSFYLAIARIPLGVAVTIEFVGPLSVAVAGSRRLLDVVWVVLAAAGVLLLAGGGGGRVTVTGLGFALLAGACWAAYILLSQRVGRLVPGLSGLALAMVVATVVLCPAGLVVGGAGLTHPSVLGTGFLVGVLSSFVPYSLELAALRRLSTRVFGVLMSLEPAMGALAGLVVLGQRLSARELVALVLVSVASAGVTLSDRRAAAAVRD